MILEDLAKFCENLCNVSKKYSNTSYKSPLFNLNTDKINRYVYSICIRQFIFWYLYCEVYFCIFHLV